VTLIDTDPIARELARKDDLPVIDSSGLDPEALRSAGIESVGTFMALTDNGEINLVLARRAIEEFGPPRVVAAFTEASDRDRGKVERAFSDRWSLKDWNRYIEDGQIKLGRTVFIAGGASEQRERLRILIEKGDLLPLLFRRDNLLQVVVSNQEWRDGDELIYLLRDPRPQLLKRLSGSVLSPRPVLEPLPEVEIAPGK
jgi:hypothetical protein